MQLTKPKHFWVTFMEGEASQKMQELGEIDFNKHPEAHLRIKRKIKIKQGRSPTDILWNNVGVAFFSKIKELIFASLVVFCIGFVAQTLFATEISA